MPLRMGALYDALLAAQVREPQAKLAAEEVATLWERLARVEADLLVIKWMVGTNVVLTMAVLGRLLFVK